MPSINGIAHIQLTVSDMERSVPFYETLLHSLEMVTLIKRPDYFYLLHWWPHRRRHCSGKRRRREVRVLARPPRPAPPVLPREVGGRCRRHQ
jgi:catechol 2,3-dioxygenase-like lactoylglutathione lyase family enzyme